MPKRSDSSCKTRTVTVKGYQYKGRFEVVDGVKYFRFIDPVDKYESQVPIKLIDRLREDEWVYDSSEHNSRKEKVK
jgi:hypothetical protein